MPGESLAAWYEKNKDALRKKQDLRAKNRVLAFKLLEMVEKDPKRLDAFRYLNAYKLREGLSLRSHLQRWHNHAPKDHRAFIRDIAKLFKYKLEIPR